MSESETKITPLTVVFYGCSSWDNRLCRVWSQCQQQMFPHTRNWIATDQNNINDKVPTLNKEDSWVAIVVCHYWHLLPHETLYHLPFFQEKIVDAIEAAVTPPKAIFCSANWCPGFMNVIATCLFPSHLPRLFYVTRDGQQIGYHRDCSDFTQVASLTSELVLFQSQQQQQLNSPRNNQEEEAIPGSSSSPLSWIILAPYLETEVLQWKLDWLEDHKRVERTFVQQITTKLQLDSSYLHPPPAQGENATIHAPFGLDAEFQGKRRSLWLKWRQAFELPLEIFAMGELLQHVRREESSLTKRHEEEDDDEDGDVASVLDETAEVVVSTEEENKKWKERYGHLVRTRLNAISATSTSSLRTTSSSRAISV